MQRLAFVLEAAALIHVEGNRLGRLVGRSREAESRGRVDEAANQPGRRKPIDARAWAGDPRAMLVIAYVEMVSEPVLLSRRSRAHGFAVLSYGAAHCRLRRSGRRSTIWRSSMHVSIEDASKTWSRLLQARRPRFEATRNPLVDWVLFGSTWTAFFTATAPTCWNRRQILTLPVRRMGRQLMHEDHPPVRHGLM